MVYLNFIVKKGPLPRQVITVDVENWNSWSHFNVAYILWSATAWSKFPQNLIFKFLILKVSWFSGLVLQPLIAPYLLMVCMISLFINLWYRASYISDFPQYMDFPIWLLGAIKCQPIWYPLSVFPYQFHWDKFWSYRSFLYHFIIIYM